MEKGKTGATTRHIARQAVGERPVPMSDSRESRKSVRRSSRKKTRRHTVRLHGSDATGRAIAGAGQKLRDQQLRLVPLSPAQLVPHAATYRLSFRSLLRTTTLSAS